jgi:sec-independent protein translocase protein TatC
MRRVKAVSHEDELSLVEHLDELRARIIVSIAVFGVALALCFWQNHLLLELASGPLPSDHNRLITFGVTEPFTTTMTVSAYGAIILSLPIILYQIYAYLLPAFSKDQQRAVLPLLLLIPVLFIAGVAFGYFVVLPAATKFLLNFNDAQFNIQVRAREYYGFFAQTLIACGVVFQVPVGVLAVTRLGIVKVKQLQQNRRYAYLACAVVAAALPGVDPVSMLLETAPLIALYELSILLARAFGEPRVQPIGKPSAQERANDPIPPATT